jgi:hypothetical protein
MLNSVVGKLVRVPLREVWPHEAYDFTQWLQENIEVLGEALDIDFDNVDREQAIGSFNIDLVGKIQSGGTVVIENQLSKSDHDHLGKLITYSVGMGASAAIWIVSDPRPEHVAAVTWLNESNSANFYMLKVEAVRIGESPPAPLLTLIVGPSEETKDVGQVKKDIAERYGLRRHWWTSLIARSKDKTKLHAHISPGESSFIQTSAGFPGLSFVYTATQLGCGAELYIDRGKGADDENLKLFNQLAASRDKIDEDFGSMLNWESLEGRRACRIRYLSNLGGYRSPEEKWPEIQDHVIDAMVRLERALRPYIARLRESP